MKSFIPQNDRQKSSIASAAQMRNIGKKTGVYSVNNFVDNRSEAIMQRQMVAAIQQNAVAPFSLKNNTVPQRKKDTIAPTGAAIQTKKGQDSTLGAGAQIAIGQCCNGKTAQMQQVIQRGKKAKVTKGVVSALSRISSSVGSILKALEKSKNVAKEDATIFGSISGGLNVIAGFMTMIEGAMKENDHGQNDGRAITGVLSGGATMIGGIVGVVGAATSDTPISDIGAGLTIAGNIGGIIIKIMDWKEKSENDELTGTDKWVLGSYIFSDAFNILAKIAAFIPGAQPYAIALGGIAGTLAVLGASIHAGSYIASGISDWWHGRRNNAQGAPQQPPQNPNSPLLINTV